jgi:hypothetical protein
MDVPWKSLQPIDANREYLALLSYLPLKQYSKIPAFMRFTFGIQKQLAGTPGVIGYSLRAQIFSKQFWTLSVWDDSAALMNFVQKLPHSESMKAMAPFMGQTKFTQWKVPGSGVPLKWNEAIGRMTQES